MEFQQISIIAYCWIYRKLHSQTQEPCTAVISSQLVVEVTECYGYREQRVWTVLVCHITVHLRACEHGCFPLAHLYTQSTVRTLSKISLAEEGHFQAKVKGLWHWVLLIPSETEATRCFALPTSTVGHQDPGDWPAGWVCLVSCVRVCVRACLCVWDEGRLGEWFSGSTITQYCLLANKQENRNTGKLIMSCLTPPLHV